MTPDNDWEEIQKGFKKFSQTLADLIEQKTQYIEHKKQKIKKGLNLLSKNAYSERCKYLLQEQQKNLKEKTDYEIRKKLGNKTWFSYKPQAHDEIDKYLAELIVLYQKYIPSENEQLKPQETLSVQSESTTIKLENATNIIATPLSFKDIFTIEDWKKYISVLYEVVNPVINKDYEFIGNKKIHTGVICSWIKELQNKGIIYRKYTRQHLAAVLNSEIKNLNMGKDGKTFSNMSSIYEEKYQNSLLKLTNLLP